jgi:carboxyl-terminal processing protease
VIHERRRRWRAPRDSPSTGVLLALLALAGCAHDLPGGVHPAAAGVVSNLDIPTSAFREEFDAVLAGIDQHYGLKELKGVDTTELRARFGPEVERARSADEFYATLVRVFAMLRNSHSGLALPSGALAEAGMGTVLVGDRLVLTGEFSDPVLRDHGLERGWEITAIDDVPLAQWMAGRGELVNASTPQYERVAAAQQATRRFWFEPVARRFTFRSPAGASLTLELRLDRAPFAFGRQPLVSGRAIGEVGYVAVNSLTGDVVSQFEGELARSIDKPALILDLRLNSGGNSGLAHPIMAHLVQQPTRVEWPNQLLQPAATLRFGGSLAVLVGPITHSAAESLAHNLKDSGRATFIGTATAGSSGNGPQLFQTAHGLVFRLATRPGQELSVSGAPTEGVGLAPHVLREQTYGDYLAGRDTVLEYAVGTQSGGLRCAETTACADGIQARGPSVGAAVYSRHSPDVPPWRAANPRASSVPPSWGISSSP